MPQSFDLPGVRRDAELWNRFLESCGIPVQWLRNPARDTALKSGRRPDTIFSMRLPLFPDGSAL